MRPHPALGKQKDKKHRNKPCYLNLFKKTSKNLFFLGLNNSDFLKGKYIYTRLLQLTIPGYLVNDFTLHFSKNSIVILDEPQKNNTLIFLGECSNKIILYNHVL